MPDLVIYLQSPTDVLRKRLRERARGEQDLPPLDDDYIKELNEAYNHFFFHYNATPLLVVETSQFDLSWGDDAVADLERQFAGWARGTRYYVPRVRCHAQLKHTRRMAAEPDEISHVRALRSARVLGSWECGVGSVSSANGVVQEAAEAHRAAGGSQPGPRGPVGQVSVLLADHL